MLALLARSLLEVGGMFSSDVGKVLKQVPRHGNCG